MSRQILTLCCGLALWCCGDGNGPSSDGDGDADGDGDVDGDVDGDGDADGDGDSDGDADGDGDADADGDGDSDGDGDGDAPLCDDAIHEGEATYYTFADGSGNCGFAATPDDLRVAAMNHTDYADSATCGTCVRAQGPIGEVTVRIVDRCPECAPGDIDFSPSAFDALARREDGRVPITWRYVPCDVTGPLVYHFKDGSNPWWSAVQVRNHRHQVARFEFLDEGGTFREVSRVSYNYFVWDSGMGPGPYTFRVTDIYGQSVTDSDIEFLEGNPDGTGGDVPGASQLPECRME